MENHKYRLCVVTAAAGLAVVLLSGGCAPVSEPPATPEKQTSSDSALPPSPSTHSESYTSVPTVTWEPEASARVKTRAAKVMNMFARPDVGYRHWFEDLRPFLRDDYAREAEYIDPANIPVSSVRSGPELLRQGGNPLTATAVFETNAGPWSVLLHWTGQNAPWLVAAIEPSEGTNTKGRH